MSDEDTEIRLEGLDKLLKALKAQPPTIRVGILGSNGAARTDGKTTNATIGMVHENGLGNCPQRSFLRVPLTDNLGKEIEASGALDNDVMKAVIASGTLEPWAKKIAVLAEGIVLTAFDSSGYGKWAALKPQTLRRKKLTSILVETQQLRDSITSEVKV